MAFSLHELEFLAIVIDGILHPTPAIILMIAIYVQLLILGFDSYIELYEGYFSNGVNLNVYSYSYWDLNDVKIGDPNFTYEVGIFGILSPVFTCISLLEK